MNQYKGTCKLSVSVSKNLRSLNEQVLRVLRYDTHTYVSVYNIYVYI